MPTARDTGTEPTEGGVAARQTQTDHDSEVTAIEEGANETTVNQEREERETPPGKSKDEGRPKRKIPARRYDETLRRNKKRRTRSGVYLESGKKRTHCKLIDAMVVGARTITNPFYHNPRPDITHHHKHRSPK